MSAPVIRSLLRHSHHTHGRGAGEEANPQALRHIDEFGNGGDVGVVHPFFIIAVAALVAPGRAPARLGMKMDRAGGVRQRRNLQLVVPVLLDDVQPEEGDEDPRLPAQAGRRGGQDQRWIGGVESVPFEAIKAIRRFLSTAPLVSEVIVSVVMVSVPSRSRTPGWSRSAPARPRCRPTGGWGRNVLEGAQVRSDEAQHLSRADLAQGEGRLADGERAEDVDQLIEELRVLRQDLTALRRTASDLDPADCPPEASVGY